MRLRLANLPPPRCPWLGEAVRRTTAQPLLRPNRGGGEVAAGAGEGLWRAARLPQASRSSLHSRRETGRGVPLLLTSSLVTTQRPGCLPSGSAAAPLLGHKQPHRMTANGATL